MLNVASRSRTTYSDCPCCGYKNGLASTPSQGRTLYYCHAGCSQADVWRALRGAESNYPPKQKTHEQSNAGGTVASKLWQKSLPAENTSIAIYLAGRGLGTIIPPSLRYLPDCHHRPSGKIYPAMIAAVTDWRGKLQAVHRTYLAHGGNGKAPVAPAKMTLGKVSGYSCHLAPASEKLAITEGIETGLSVLFASGIPTWAALSAGGMRNLILPPLPLANFVMICADNDPVGVRSAQQAAFRWREEGRRIKIAVPPAADTDFNDLLQEAAQ